MVRRRGRTPRRRRARGWSRYDDGDDDDDGSRRPSSPGSAGGWMNAARRPRAGARAPLSFDDGGDDDSEGGDDDGMGRRGRSEGRGGTTTRGRRGKTPISMGKRGGRRGCSIGGRAAGGRSAVETPAAKRSGGYCVGRKDEDDGVASAEEATEGSEGERDSDAPRSRDRRPNHHVRWTYHDDDGTSGSGTSGSEGESEAECGANEAGGDGRAGRRPRNASDAAETPAARPGKRGRRSRSDGDSDASADEAEGEGDRRRGDGDAPGRERASERAKAPAARFGERGAKRDGRGDGGGGGNATSSTSSCSSDGDSETSMEEVTERGEEGGNNKDRRKLVKQSKLRTPAAQFGKREVQRKGREDDGDGRSSGGSDVEGDGSVEVVKERVQNKNGDDEPKRMRTDRFIAKTPARPNKGDKRYEGRKDYGSSSDSDSGSESDASEEEVKESGNNESSDDNKAKRPHSRQSNANTPAAQSRQRERQRKGREEDDGSSSSSDSDSSSDSKTSVQRARKGGNDKKPPNQSNINNARGRLKTIKRTTFNKIGNAGLRERSTPDNAPSRDVMKLVNGAAIPEDITSVSQLQWYRILLLQTEERTRETLKPCRVLSRGEASKYRRSNNISNASGKVIQYLTFPNVEEGLYKCVDDNSLIPFGYKARDGLSTTFNDDYLQRYLQQNTKITRSGDLEAARLFLRRVFDHARDEEKKSRDRASQDLQDYYDDSPDNDIDGGGGSSQNVSDSKRVQFEAVDNEGDDDGENTEMDDLDVPYTQAITFDPDDFGTMEEERSNEPIRPGDVVEYYSPVFVAGDARGLRQASVLAVNPNEETPLVLSNGDRIPSNTKVKRIKVLLDGELVDHPGIFRPIYRFKLLKLGSATAADAVALEARRFGRIMQKNMKTLREKAQAEGFAPMDMLVNVKGGNDDNSMKAQSRAKPSTSVSSCGKEPKSPPSSDDSGDSDASVFRSGLDNKKAKLQLKPQTKKAPAIDNRAIKASDNKENNGSALIKGTRTSSSAASLGSSLASSESDDSSIDMTPVNLGREKFVTPKPSKANAKAENDAVAADLSLSSDDDSSAIRKKAARDKRKTPPKARSSSVLRSPNSVNSESSLETPTSFSVGKQRESDKLSPMSSVATSLGLSKRRLELGSTPKNKKAESWLAVLANEDVGGKDSDRQTQKRRTTAPPLSPLSVGTPTSSDSPRSEHSPSSSNSIQSVDLDISKPRTKKRSSPSYNLFSYDDSDGDRHTNKKVYNTSKKPPRRKQRDDSFESSGSHGTEKDVMGSENPPASHKAINSSGWTQGKAGWEKSEVGGPGSFGFGTFGRFK